MKRMEHWKRKFAHAFSGIVQGTRDQSSFAVHVPAGIGVCGLAWWLACEVWQWCVLLICIALVLTLELLNSALEFLAKGLCHEHNENVGKALDTASGAVLVVSLFAVVIGLLVLGGQSLHRLGFI